MGTVPNYKFVGEYVKSQFERGRNALEEGVYDRAIELFTSALRARGMNPEIEAEIRSSLSEAFEEDTNGKEALDAVIKYETLSDREILPLAIQTTVWLRMGLAYDRLANHPKAISYLNTSLKLAQGLNDATAIGRAHLALGRSYFKVDEYQISYNHLDQAAESFRLVGNRRLLVQSYLSHGTVLIREGKHEEALVLLESAERLIGDKPYHSLLGHIMQNRAVLNGVQQRVHEAMEYQERAVACFERTGQRRHLLISLNNLASCLFSLGEIDRAKSEWERAVQIAREFGQASWEAMILEGLAQVDILRADYSAAEENLQSSLSILTDLKFKWYEVQVRQTVARLFLDRGDVESAITEAGNVAEIAEQIGNEHGVIIAQICLAEAEILRDDLDKAQSLTDAIESKLFDDGDLLTVGLVRRLRSKILLAKNQSKEAAALAAQSVSAFEALSNKYHIALGQLEWGKALLNGGDPKMAREVLGRAALIFEQLKAKRDIDKVNDILRKCEVAPQRLIANSEFSLTSIERLLNAVIARELLIHELVSVLRDLPEVQRVAVFDLSASTPPILIAGHGWSSDQSYEQLVAVRMNPSGVSHNGYVRLHWLDSAKDGNKERSAVLVETDSGSTSPHIHLLLRLVQQGLELCSLRRDRTPKLTEAIAAGTELANAVGLVIGSPR
jgi:tetratricopeptide (TPR) repeat protein